MLHRVSVHADSWRLWAGIAYVALVVAIGVTAGVANTALASTDRAIREARADGAARFVRSCENDNDSRAALAFLVARIDPVRLTPRQLDCARELREALAAARRSR